jgi:hypothetical protein
MSRTMPLPTADAAPLFGAAPPVAPGLAPPLHLPLPAAVAGRDHGWLTDYRRWPVFSPAWARGRSARLAPLIVICVSLTMAGVIFASGSAVPWGALVQIALTLCTPLFAGPWLGSLVRRQGWAPRTEWAGLVAVVTGLVLGVAAFNEWGAEPVKQKVSEWVGHVDANGQRKKVAVMFGVTIRPADPADTAASGAARAQPSAAEETPTRPPLMNHLSFALITFALAGGFALPRWSRERTGLLALAHEEALARAQAQRREAELQLSVLAAQVEPHFLFNTLAGVRSAIATDPARASVMVDQLADYLRGAIPRLRSDGTSAASTLGHQVDFVAAYLGLMRSRMPRLAVRIDVPAELRDAPCPPLMLISLAENALRHGVEPKVGPALVSVTACRQADGRLAVTVEDDGVGFGGAASAGTGIGLANIRARLAQMHGDRAALALKSRPEGGVSATLLLPAEGGAKRDA